MRIHRRYLLINVLGAVDKIELQDVLEALKENIEINWGALGLAWASVGLKVIHFSPKAKSFVIRIPTDMMDVVMSSMMLVTKVLEFPMTLAVSQICGSWKKAKMLYIEEHQKRTERGISASELTNIIQEIERVQEA